MAFGIYIHIPYCIQKCTYCDFATYEQSRTIPIADYQKLLLEEIRQTQGLYPQGKLTSVYFGGGTPSLAPASFIVEILDQLAKFGFQQSPETEITIEINPGTLTLQKIETYLKAGVNRFSVGVQSFNETLIKDVKREHSVSDTRQTLQELQRLRVNFSADLLFALPGQTLDILASDLEQLLQYDPAHISAYCLTVNDHHALAPHRLSDVMQIDMFNKIEQILTLAQYQRYELSSYARPGFKSQHNNLYWTNENYWGLGLSAHSYLKLPQWGLRFWNPSTMGGYKKQIEAARGKTLTSVIENLASNQYEQLKKHEALTDFCHVSLRKIDGLDTLLLTGRFGESTKDVVISRLKKLEQKNWLRQSVNKWILTPEGRLLSNQIFFELTFLETDLPRP